MERPRVLILGKLPPPYIGPAVATKIILESALTEYFELHHFDTKINNDVAQMGSFKWYKISVIRGLYKAFRQTLISVQPQIVLIPIGQTSAGFLKDIPFIRNAAKSGAKVIIQLRGSEWRDWYNGLDILRRQMALRLLRKAHGAIVLGDNLRFIFQGIIPDDRIFVVPNGGDYAFPPRSRDAASPVRILYLANYLPGKGLLELLRALKLLSAKANLPAWEFHAYGSWDSDTYKEECARTATALGNCYLHGVASGEVKWQAFADADLFVFVPRDPEGHPWCIVEALAAALPIVATNRGAIAQSVVHHHNGMLLQNPFVPELAEALAMLIADENLRKKYAAASLELYRRHFNAKAMTDKLGEVFTHVSD